VIFWPFHSNMAKLGKIDRNALLLRALSIDPGSFSAFLECARISRPGASRPSRLQGSVHR
jgi:hypothetical protein